MQPEALLFHSSNQSLNHPVLLRGMGSDELLFQTILVHRPSVVSGGKHQAVVTSRALPSVPYRLMRASSRAASAALALPLGLNRHPNASRVWQSMTMVRAHQR